MPGAGEEPRRMLRTVSVLPVAIIERRRSETPERSIRSRRRCLKLLFESEAVMRFPPSTSTCESPRPWEYLTKFTKFRADELTDLTSSRILREA